MLMLRNHAPKMVVVTYLLLLFVYGSTCQLDPTKMAGKPQDRNIKKQNLEKGLRRITVSYLGAFSEMSKIAFETLSNYNKENETGLSNDSNVKKMDCLNADFLGSYISGAFHLAVEEINADSNLLPNHRLVYVFNNTCREELLSTKYFMDHWAQGVKAFFGFEIHCRTAAVMAAAQNIPIISHKCGDQSVSNIGYPTFARTVPAETEITAAFLSLFNYFKWRKFSIICDNSERNRIMLETIEEAVKRENKRLKEAEDSFYTITNISVFPFSDVVHNNLSQTILDTYRTTRIYLTFGNVRLFRCIMLEMGALGLMDTGDYALVYLDADYDWLNVYHAMNNHFLRDTLKTVSESWDNPDSVDRRLINYSRSAIAIIPTPVQITSPKFQSFWRKSNEFSKLFKRYRTLESAKSNRFACYLYDAVKLYAAALTAVLNETTAEEIERGYDPISDGEKIMKKIIGRTYRSMQGFEMRIDKNGNALGNYTLLAFQKVEPVLNSNNPSYYPFDAALTVTADFVYDTSGVLPILRFKHPIQWENGKPPVDEPECGFFGEKCSIKRDLLIWGFSSCFSIVAVALLGVTYFFWRDRRHKKDSDSFWKIEPLEITDIIGWNFTTSPIVFREDSLTEIEEDERKWTGRWWFGRYKGATVLFKYYPKRMKNLSHEIKKEVKAMRKLQNDNLTVFWGLVVESLHIRVVWEYHEKGSLYDNLRNETWNLDTIFNLSFIDDLLKACNSQMNSYYCGLEYLHQSDIKFHGNLKSTNCLIDNHWVLKLSNYGLHELRNRRIQELLENDSCENDDEWRKFLWTAPELLNSEDYMKGSQEGDIYSFGIILHEIHTRCGPFMLSPESSHWSAKDIIDKVKSAGLRPYCGALGAQDFVLETMIKCWSEEPRERPDISRVRNALKRMFDDYKGSAMDHALSKMEMYQKHLEELVRGRTAQLEEEKQKTEQLLQRMLPRSVAEQLIAGKDVKPEFFEAVTIYFSDIVGFTALSDKSAPMEIVTFLNKLYTLFDNIIKRYNVYKVETIGDAYMVVSGVPEKCEDDTHAEEIGKMALHLHYAVKDFCIPHRNDEKVELRTGIHTGQCVAGVVGKTMPRYCLFGDTVNTASRMESTGEPLRIHCSEAARNVLVKFQSFALEERGILQIKGKGKMRTFWLKGKCDLSFPVEDSCSLTEETSLFSVESKGIFVLPTVVKYASSHSLGSAHFTISNVLQRLAERPKRSLSKCNSECSSKKQPSVIEYLKPTSRDYLAAIAEDSFLVPNWLMNRFDRQKVTADFAASATVPLRRRPCKESVNNISLGDQSNENARVPRKRSLSCGQNPALCELVEETADLIAPMVPCLSNDSTKLQRSAVSLGQSRCEEVTLKKQNPRSGSSGGSMPKLFKRLTSAITNSDPFRNKCNSESGSAMSNENSSVNINEPLLNWNDSPA